MDATLIENVNAWIAEDPDPATRQELQDLLHAKDEGELRDRFSGRLEFGTAGLRGLMGGGPNRMNRLIIRKVTRGLADYLLQEAPECEERGVVLGYDARQYSREFAEDAASVLAGAGIPVYTYETTVSTPRLAFTCGALEASAGIVITASHNPPAYNGYKVYWGNAAQIIPPHDAGISKAIDAVGPAGEIPFLEEVEARRLGRWRDVPPTVADTYLDRVNGLCLHPQAPRDFDVVYTPLHGVGAEDMRAAMGRAGFERFHVVAAQAEPDGEFPTVEFPNPEEPGAMDLALEVARGFRAPLVLAHDPDADRLAVALRDDAGEYCMLTGNEIGVMLGHYVLSHYQGNETPLVCTTIVSTSMLSKIAASFGAAYEELLTGFKWIADKAMELERDRGHTFLLGFEEALGYTVRDIVRDKDGVGAGVLFSDLAAWCFSEQRTPLEYLDGLYETYGFHASTQRSLTLPGQEGIRRIGALMDFLRASPPQAFAGSPVVEVTDFLQGERRRIPEGQSDPVLLPRSNVLRYLTRSGARLLVRPSGTEPKIKFYGETVTDLKTSSRSKEAIQREAEQVVDAFVEDRLKALDEASP